MKYLIVFSILLITACGPPQINLPSTGTLRPILSFDDSPQACATLKNMNQAEIVEVVAKDNSVYLFSGDVTKNGIEIVSSTINFTYCTVTVMDSQISQVNDVNSP